MGAIIDKTGNGMFADILPRFHTNDHPRDCYRWHFPTLADLAASLPDERPTTARICHSESWQHGNASWSGVSSMADAKRLAVEGWREGVARVEDIARRVSAAVPTVRKIARHDFAGALPNVPRYLAGDPCHMRTVTLAPTARRPVLTLVSSIGAPATTDAGAMVRNAAFAAAITDRLEASGYRVEMLAAYRIGGDLPSHDANTPRKCRHEIAWRAKAASDPIDLSALAFSLGHPAAARRLGFGVFQSVPCVRDDDPKAMGYTVALHAITDRPAATFILPGAGDVRGTDEDNLRRIARVLTEQGCPALDIA